MNARFVFGWPLAATLAAVALPFSVNQTAAFQPGPPAAQAGVEVLTRGPVHEAFAETVSFDPEPGLVAPKAPPPAIEEAPPEQRPEGANVNWIPGYWAWDDERNDFLWVSGIWRALPPGRQWVSGYWGSTTTGAQWTSGYWADATASEVEYLPEPPATMEIGPNIAAPSAAHTWLPGCWVWRQTRYAWRPGYWAPGQANWTWMPAHYQWAPRGYVYIDGYYDYNLAQRGVLFAPVYFNADVYSQRGFSYSPWAVINPAVFTTHFFLRPSYGHYYFGDYYAANYVTLGYSPWFSFSAGHSGYEPFYAQQHWQHRDDNQWDRRLADDFTHRRDHEDARPPRTWNGSGDRAPRDATTSEKNFVMAASLAELAKSKDTPVRLQPVTKAEREQIGQRGAAIGVARDFRRKVEAEMSAPSAPSAAAATRADQAVKVKLPQAPIAWKGAAQPGKNEGPPPAIEAPQPDVKVEPKPRKARVNTVPPAESKGPPAEAKTPPRESKPERPQVEPKEQPKREVKDTPPGRTTDRPDGPPKGPPQAPPQGPPQNKAEDKPQDKPKGEK